MYMKLWKTKIPGICSDCEVWLFLSLDWLDYIICKRIRLQKNRLHNVVKIMFTELVKQTLFDSYIVIVGILEFARIVLNWTQFNGHFGAFCTVLEFFLCIASASGISCLSLITRRCREWDCCYSSRSLYWLSVCSHCSPQPHQLSVLSHWSRQEKTHCR